jgi:methenyltetrahydrofolate cyclohydrolase
VEKLTLKEFTLQVASSEPAPGGGSVSALAGAQAAALLSMYCRLSLGKKGLEDVQNIMDTTLKKAEELSLHLLDDVRDDTLAFNAVVEAFKLSKASDEQKKVRAAAIQEAFEVAARVPLGVAASCLQILDLVSSVVGKGNNTAISDIGVANLQAWAGLQGAAYNLEINLSSLKDQALVSELKERVESICARGAKLNELNASIVEEVLKGE